MTYEEKKERQVKINNIAYYLIIGVVSIVVTGFVPMLSSEIGLQWQVPNTTAGWIVWVLARLCIAGVNMLLFYCFMQQAKVNVKDNPKYVQAKEIMHKSYKAKKLKPKSPEEWSAKQYLSKGSTLLISTLLSTIGLTQAILTFNMVEFLTNLFTILMGITFGYLQMKKAEDYWTSEFYEYALMVQEKIVEQEQESKTSDLTPSKEETKENIEENINNA